MLAFLVSLSLSGPLCPEVRLDAEIGAHGRDIRGSIRCVAQKDQELFLATYPGVLSDPHGLDDVNRSWFYPEGFDPAGMKLIWRQERRLADGPWMPLGRVSRGEPVTIQFATRVPRRNGAFGVSDATTYLLGGWHPAFGHPGELPRVRYRFRIRIPHDVSALVGEELVGADEDRIVEGELEGRYVPIVLAPAIEAQSVSGARLLMPMQRRSSHPDSSRHPAISLRDLSSGRDVSTLTELSRTLAIGARYGERAGLNPRPVLVVLAPLRDRLVEAFDGGLAVSDRAFHLLGFERFLMFHRSSIWREQLAYLTLPHARGRRGWLEPELVADFVGAALRAQLVASSYEEAEDAAQILERFAVIPEIDALLFAPQISFVDSYFSAIDETPERRIRLDDFYHEHPRGKLLYEKLCDALGAGTVNQIVAAYLASDESFSHVAERVAGAPLRPILLPWLGPYPAVDYAIADVKADGSSIRVRLEARGPAANELREPLTVSVVDADGTEHRVTRVGPGWAEVKAPGPPKVVQLDPDHRLVETHQPEARYRSRFNNRWPPRWRFLLNNIASLIAVTNGELTAAVDFSLRRIHDLGPRVDFFALYGPSSFGGATTFSYGFGSRVTPLHNDQRLGLSIGYERLRSESGGSAAGYQGSATLFYRFDDRLNPYWSFEGKGLSLRLSGALARDESGGDYGSGQAGASAFYILPIAFYHALLLRVGADAILGDAPSQNELSLGGRYRGIRGYERDEVRGRTRATASMEYRHAWAVDARTDLGGLVLFKRLEGALFADVAFVPPEREACAQKAFFDVGYGLRFIGDVFGVSPAEIAVDVGVPLNRCPGERSRSPVAVYVAFVQSFSSF